MEEINHQSTSINSLSMERCGTKREVIIGRLYYGMYFIFGDLFIMCHSGKHFSLWLRLFRRKIFSTVKYLQMQMIYKKMIVFPVFVGTLENVSENILLCVFGAT